MGGRLNLRHLQYRMESYGQSPPIESYLPPNWSNMGIYSVATRPTQSQNIIAAPPPPLPPLPIATEPVVIGVMVLDINATPNSAAGANQYTRLSASPGKVAYDSGGVARNVAECMSKLKGKSFMISAVGYDWAGDLLWEHWRATGLSEQGILRRQDIETAVSCNIFDGKGELTAAVASVESIETLLNPSWIGKFKSKISTAPILMVDANLSSLSLAASCQMAANFSTPVWFDPASVAKSRRIASVVHYVNFVSANEDELIAMANVLSGRDIFSPVRRDQSSTVESLFELLKPAIWVLLRNGVKVIIVTIGSHGAFLCSNSKSDLGGLDFKDKRPSSSSKQLCEAINKEWLTDQFLGASRYNLFSDFYAVHFPALSASVVRVNGAGDCLVGGTIASLCAGLDFMRSISVGIAASKFSVEAETNIPAEQSLEAIAYAAMRVYSGMSVSQRKNPSLIGSTSNLITPKHLATSQPPPQLQSQSQNPIGDHAPLLRGSTNNYYQISRQIDEQMTVRGQEYEQSISTIISQLPGPSVPQKKYTEEKPKYSEILTNNIRNEAMQKEKHEESQAMKEKEEEEDAQLWKTVKSKKEKKRSVKEANQRTTANGRNINKHAKY